MTFYIKRDEVVINRIGGGRFVGEVIANTQVAQQVYRLQVKGDYSGRMGQFYMVRAWGQYPLLSRPLSIFNIGEGVIEFLYLVTGQGTELLSRLKAGDDISLEGPLGNGFPELIGKTAFIGGGIGIAPFYYGLQSKPEADVYLGYSKEDYVVADFQMQCKGNVTVNVGGLILDDVDFIAYDTIIACGPHAMLQAVQSRQRSSGTGADVYVSLENRMACGIGACLVCSVKCLDTRKKACTDGPVFRAQEVILS
jgi:dihydroorotate dehydrogenase electron transfer subunit